MSADIIRFIPRPKSDRGPTAFPIIAFRAALRPGDLAVDHGDTAPCEYAPCDCEEKATKQSSIRRKPSFSSDMSKTATELRSLARSHTKSAINVLASVMRSKDATHAARVSAANAILDRGWGKAAQALENGDDGALELICKIERIIVHPENTDSKDF